MGREAAASLELAWVRGGFGDLEVVSRRALGWVPVRPERSRMWCAKKARCCKMNGLEVVAVLSIWELFGRAVAFSLSLLRLAGKRRGVDDC